MGVERYLLPAKEPGVGNSITSPPDHNIHLATWRISQFEGQFETSTSTPTLSLDSRRINPFITGRRILQVGGALLSVLSLASDSKPVLSQNIASNSPKTGENNLVLENTPPSEKAFQNLPAYPPTNVEQTKHPEAVTVLSNYSVEGFSASGDRDVYGLVTDKITGKQYAVGIGIDSATKSVYFERYTESPIRGQGFLVAENNSKVQVIVGKDSAGKFTAFSTEDGWKTNKSVELGGIGGKPLQISPDGKYLFASRRNEDGSADIVRLNIADGQTKKISVNGIGNEDYVISSTRLTAVGTDIYASYGVVVSWRGYFKFEFKPDSISATNLHPESGSPDDNLAVFGDNQGTHVLLINNHFNYGGAILEHVNDAVATQTNPDRSLYRNPQNGVDIASTSADVSSGTVLMGTSQPVSSNENTPYIEAYPYLDPIGKHKLMNKNGAWPSNGFVISLFPKKLNGGKFLIAVTETPNSTGDGFLTSTLAQNITSGISLTEEWKKVTEVIPAAGTAISSFKVTIPVVLNSTSGR